MNISLLCPTRGNLRGLRRMLDSLNDLTEYPEQVELLLKADLDDPELPRIKQLLHSYDTIQHSLYIEERSERLIDDYYNWLAARAKGALIMAYNDTARMLTPGWDHRLMEAARGHAYALIATRDTTRGKQRFPCFPVLTRPLMEAIGSFFFPGVRMWGSDGLLWQFCRDAQLVVPCPEVMIEHVHDQSPERAAKNKRYTEAFNADCKSGVLPYDCTRYLMKLYRMSVVKERYIKGVDLANGGAA